MNLSKISSEELKKLHIFDKLENDPLYTNLLSIGYFDAFHKEEASDLDYMYTNYSPDLFMFIGCLIPEIIFLLVYNIVPFNNISILWYILAGILFFGASAIISWHYSRDSEGITRFMCWANVIAVLLTYIIIFFAEKSVSKTLTNCIIFHIAAGTVIFITNFISAARHIMLCSKAQKQITEVANDAEEIYKETILGLNERVELCSNELDKRGEAHNLRNRIYWWNSDFSRNTLGYGEDIFKRIHFIEYCNSYSSFTSASENKLVLGKEFIHKPLNEEQKWKILRHIANNSAAYDSIGTITADEYKQNKLYAVICHWSKVDKTKYENYNVTPSQDEIAEAKKRINAEVDADERFYNALKHDRAFTMDEMHDAYGEKGADYKAKFVSETIRQNKLDNYISSYSGTEVNESSDSDSGDYIVAYTIGNLIYIPLDGNSMPTIKCDWEITNMQNWLPDYESEINGLIETFILKNKTFANYLSDMLFIGIPTISNINTNAGIMQTISALNENMYT